MDIPNSIQFRSIVAHTPLKGQLGFKQMSGSEGLSQLFHFEVELVADNYNLDLKSVLGKPLTIEIQARTGLRYLNGQVTRCEMVGRENSTSRYYIYKTTVRPWLWYLTQTSDNKIFQKKSIPDVIKEVLEEYGFAFEMRLTGSYRNWEYCVQYQETDFAFISRLMEHEGIYYYFKHENGQHTLVMADDIAAHEPMAGYDYIPYYGPDRLGKPQEEYISLWEIAAQITPDGYATVDYDFTKPGASLDAVSKRSGGSESGNLEMFEWQGGFQEPDHGEQYSKIRLQELQSVQEQNRGLSNARGIAAGYVFDLKSHPRSAENREYLVVSVNYRMSVAGYSSGTGSEDFYEVSFVVLPSSIQYRAPRITHHPRTHGPQTARVVGPAGEEIWTDKYGRIKVQFHWDRYGKKNENSSCWVRVSSPWAGGGFGGLQLPRINDEVVVDFIGGCPDRPIVLGRVYNDNNMPPVELPANSSQSGFRSQSVHGDPSMANWLLFEDKLGAELAHMKAQLNMLMEINNDCNHHIGNNHTTTVGGCQHVTVQNETHITRQGITNEQLNAAVKREINSDYNTIINGVLNSSHMGNLIDKRTGEVVKNQIGSISDTVEGNIVKELTGNKTSTHSGDLNDTITGMVTQIVNGKLNQEVHGPSKKTYNGTVDTTVNGFRTSQADNARDTVGLVRQTYTGVLAVTASSVAISGYGLNLIGTVGSFAAHAWTGTAAAVDFSAKGTKTKLAGLRQDVDGVKTDISGIQSDINTVRTDVDGVSTGVKAVESSVSNLETRIKAAKLHVGGVKINGTGLKLDA